MKKYNLKIFFLKRKVIFPYCTADVILEKSEISEFLQKGDKLIAYSIRSVLDILFYKRKIAVLSEILSIDKLDDRVKIQLKGISRVKLLKIKKFRSSIFYIIEEEVNDSLADLKNHLKRKSQELIFLINVNESDQLIKLINLIVNVHQVSDFISNYFVLKFKDRYRLLRILNVEKRSMFLSKILDKLVITMKDKREKDNI